MRQPETTAPEEDEEESRREGLEVGGGLNPAPVLVRERSGVRASRDLAIEPTTPDAPEPVLTEEEIRQAIRYNAFRFKDPYSIAIVRDIVGVPASQPSRTRISPRGGAIPGLVRPHA